MAQPRYYTTQQVAKLLGVTIPTVVNWIKQGRLEAHKTPGGHRRIAQDALEGFAAAYNCPLPGAPTPSDDAAVKRVLIVDAERDFSDMVAEYLQLKGDFEVRTAGDALEAGFHMGHFKPHVLLLDLEVERVGAADLLRLHKLNQGQKGLKIIGTTTFRGTVPPERIKEIGISRVLEKPVKLDLVLATIVGVLP